MHLNPGSTLEITSRSVGESARFWAHADLRQAVLALPAAPTSLGRVSLIVKRVQNGLRRTPDRVRLSPSEGVPGDAWGNAWFPKPDAQLAVMQWDVASLIAHGQPLELFGDNLFLELDLSRDNLPTGSRLQLGAAVVEVTPKAHNGCKKFRARFGLDALKLVNEPELRHRNLRGIYMRTVEPGEVAVGDPVHVLSRPGTGD